MGRRVLVGGTLGPLADAAAEHLRARGLDPVVLGPIDDTDIACGLAHVDNDICVAAIAAIGQYLRVLEDASQGECAVVAAELCKDCRSVCLPALLSTALARAGHTRVAIVELTSADIASCCPSPALERPSRPAIGVCGSVPVLTTELFHHTVVQHVRSCGCDVVFPPLAHLVHGPDFLTPAIEHFREAGIRTVVCIVAFGCLGGHVYARGQLRRLQRKYPDVEITVLDYDPSASDINVVNRIELVLQSALGTWW